MANTNNINLNKNCPACMAAKKALDSGEKVTATAIKKIRLMQRRINALEKLNTSYRLGTYPSELLLNELEKTKSKLEAL